MRLGVTRGHGTMNGLEERAKQRGIELVALPLIEPQPIAFDWPADLSIGDVDWVFFTSANGVDAFFTRLAELNLEPVSHTRFAIVGAKTAETLAQRQCAADFIPKQPSGEGLFQEFVETYGTKPSVVVYARGRKVHFDPETFLSERNIVCRSLVCYESRAVRLDPKIVAPLTAGDYILFTAPSAVSAYHEQFGGPKARPIAIGPTTAAAMTDMGWTDVTTMKQPEIDRVLEYL